MRERNHCCHVRPVGGGGGDYSTTVQYKLCLQCSKCCICVDTLFPRLTHMQMLSSRHSNDGGGSFSLLKSICVLFYLPPEARRGKARQGELVWRGRTRKSAFARKNYFAPSLTLTGGGQQRLLLLYDKTIPSFERRCSTTVSEGF